MPILRHPLRETRGNHEPVPAWLLNCPIYALSAAGRDATWQLNAALHPLGLDVRSFATLAVIVATNPVPQRTIADRTGIDRTTVSDTTKALEAAGYVTRERDDDDRRLWGLKPTLEGARLLEAASDPIALVENRLFRRISHAERNSLGTLLNALSADHLVADRQFKWIRSGVSPNVRPARHGSAAR
jgi:DNA-binding MarR family transcriptional regulator